MKKTKLGKAFFTVFMAIISLTMVFCSDDGKKEGTKENGDNGNDNIEIFSWWTSPGEAEALQALIDVFQENSNVEVLNLSAMLGHGQNARDELRKRMDDNNPPDVFQLGPRDIPIWTQYNGDSSDNRLESLDALFEAEGWTEFYPQAVLDTLKWEGKYYAVPINMHRQNSMFYNTNLISHEDVPDSLETFFELAERLVEEGITPLALSASGGWTLDIIFASVLSGSQGADFHKAFYSGELDLADADVLARLELAVDDYLKVISYTNDNASELGWDEAAKLVYDGDAAMYIHGDWATGYFRSLGWAPGDDFGAAPVPGTSEHFIYNVDTFALCKDAPNRENALNFLRVAGNAAAQAAFNPLKGSTPIHSEVNTSDWDLVAKATLSHYQDASLRHNVEQYQFSLPGEGGQDGVGMADVLKELYEEDLTNEEAISTKEQFIQWIVDSYEEATK